MNPDLQAAAQQWIDGLIAGHCTEGDFVVQILLLEDEDPDIAWEVLAALDRLYRRGRLSEERFARVKRSLQHECLGYGTDAALDAEMRAARASPRLRVGSLDASPPPRPPSSPSQGDAARPAPGLADHVLSRHRPGDVLNGRYRVLDIHHRTDASLFIEAVDQVRVDLPGVSARVALYLFSDERSRDLELVQRVYQLQSLAHPCITRIHDVDEEDGELFFTMEWLDGVSLQQKLQRFGTAGLSPAIGHGILACVAAALLHAHGRKVGHGDLSTASVWIMPSGEVRLQGFLLHGRGQVARVAADHVAFARLVYELCGRRTAPGNAGQALEQKSLRRPPGVTRKQWQVLRPALQGEAASGLRLLQTFAADSRADVPRIAPDRVTFAAPRHGRGRPLMAAASVAVAVLGLGGYLVFTDSARDAGANSPVTGTATVPTPPVAVRQAASSAGGSSAVQPVRPAAAPVAEAPAVESVVTNEPPVSTQPAARDLLDFPRTLVQVSADQTLARVLVRRRGNLRGPAMFQWWTEAGSAQPERDFANVTPRWEVMAEGSAGIELLVPLVSDPARTDARFFYVKIGLPGDSVVLGPRTLAQVEIIPTLHTAMPPLVTLARRQSQ